MIENVLDLGWPALVAIGTGCVAGIGVIVEVRGRKIFSPKTLSKDVNNIGDMVREHTTDISGLIQENVHQNQIVQESVVKPLERITGQMDEMMAKQTKNGETLARVQEAQKGYAHALDAMSKRFDREVPKPHIK